MKNFDLNSMGVHEMNTLEMQETDGGIIWLLIAAAAVLCGGCIQIQGNEVNIQTGDNNKNVQTSTQNMDSTLNGNTPNLSVPMPGTPAVSINPNW